MMGRAVARGTDLDNRRADMGPRFSFVLVVFFFAATLIVAVYLRGANRRVFYQLCTYRMEQRRLQQELWQQQLRVESLINPASVSRRLVQ
jgi:cytochrome c-type biogenesis protein CcmE